MDAYIGLEAEPGSQKDLYRMLTDRKIESYLTLGAYGIICKLPSFSDLDELKQTIYGILFTNVDNRPLVENITSYVVMEQHRKQSGAKPTAFCFVRSGRLSSREQFDGMISTLSRISSVVAVSVVIGLFDLVCEIVMKDIAGLKATIDQILSTPGVSTRATMICIVTDAQTSTSQ